MYFNPCHEQAVPGPCMMTSPIPPIDQPGSSRSFQSSPSEPLDDEAILQMSKDVLKIYPCRWNTRSSSTLRDLRSDCGVWLACFANLEKHLLHHTQSAYNQAADHWECCFANCSTFNFDSQEDLMTHVTSSHIHHMFLVCPAAGCAEVTNKARKLCDHVRMKHATLNKRMGTKPSFSLKQQSKIQGEPLSPKFSLPTGPFPVYKVFNSQTQPAELLFLPSSPTPEPLTPTKQHGYHIQGVTTKATRPNGDIYSSNLDKDLHQHFQRASLSMSSNPWATIGPSPNEMAPVIQPMIKKRLAGTSLIGAPPAISRAQAQQEAESHVTEDLRVHSVPTVTPSFPPAPPADKKTIGFSYVWHNWRRSEEGMTHGPEVEDEWRQRTRKRELQKRELGTKNPIHSTDMASSTPRTPAATQVTVAGPSRAVAKKTPQIPKAGLARILKRKRMVLSDPED